ncbi:putative tRNA sulfurtransferase [Heracleum sosnowskyi]|uniref:tRNA sulfurtransferase n=1 Tax=Heracleum sosnowskyi TaxID=360622 RepID=A0AAD8JAT7_9APIA|nr:putative tRNA sulfurtransferase [Heracleum sosnowskyi]
MSSLPGMPTNMEDYSASSTLIPFSTPLPLLRQPIPVSQPDDPSLGPFTLAFKTPQSFTQSFTSCQSQITHQCESGSRAGCSISASNKCKPIWWKPLIGLSNLDFKEREVCEEREMERCFLEAKGKCVSFGREKCVGVFREARVAVDWRNGDKRSVGKLVWLASLMESESLGFEFLRSRVAVTSYRGCELLGDHLDVDMKG